MEACMFPVLFEALLLVNVVGSPNFGAVVVSVPTDRSVLTSTTTQPDVLVSECTPTLAEPPLEPIAEGEKLPGLEPTLAEPTLAKPTLAEAPLEPTPFANQVYPGPADEEEDQASSLPQLSCLPVLPGQASKAVMEYSRALHGISLLEECEEELRADAKLSNEEAKAFALLKAGCKKRAEESLAEMKASVNSAR